MDQALTGAVSWFIVAAMDVEVSTRRRVVAPVSSARIAELMGDLEGTLRLFPKLHRLEAIGDRREEKLDVQRFEWELEPIGFPPAGISHVVRYATDVEVDIVKGRVRLCPVEGHGNALISGLWQNTDRPDGTEIALGISGKLRGIPVPLALRMAATPFVRARFTALVHRFLDRLAQAAGVRGDQILDLP